MHFLQGPVRRLFVFFFFFQWVKRRSFEKNAGSRFEPFPFAHLYFCTKYSDPVTFFGSELHIFDSVIFFTNFQD